MNIVTILNDIHLGFKRNTGTTPASREALRNYLFNSFEAALPKEGIVIVAGDLFDSFEVDPRDWILTYFIFDKWLKSHDDNRLVLVAGNHDWSQKGEKVSSFQMLSEVLTKQYGLRFCGVGIDEQYRLNNLVFLAHCSNQETFNIKLKEILEQIREKEDNLILHANYDNHFAVEADHSLNVSKEQAKAFIDKNVDVFFAHIHQHDFAFHGALVIFGNQWPTSISDCLGNERKYMNTFHLQDGTHITHETWNADSPEGFKEIDWRDLRAQGMLDIQAGFVRVVGTATANEAGQCLSDIGWFRSKAPSSIFVVSNAVKIEGIADNETLPEAFEATQTFDVLEFIKGNLSEEQWLLIEKLNRS